MAVKQAHAASFSLQGRLVGGERPFVIAEVAQTHDGSLGLAHSFIDVAADCGADAIKFQTHIADQESTRSEPWRVPFSRQDETRYDYWRRMEFSAEQWHGLKLHADDRGIVFMSSPFSVRACEILEQIGMPAWKLASGEVHNAQLLDWIVATKKPIIMSSGLSTVPESVKIANRLLSSGSKLAVLHCTTKYPTPAEEVGVNVMLELMSSLPVPIGISDHSGRVTPGVVAAYLGAAVIEVHLTLHQQMFGPDVPSSLTPAQLRLLVDEATFAASMRAHVIDKSSQLESMGAIRRTFGRSLVAAADLAVGTVLTRECVQYKKPGGGMEYEDLDRLLGKRLVRNVGRDEALRLEDVG